MKGENSNLDKQSDKNQVKETWKTPEIVDLSINEGTQNTTKSPGRTTFDGNPTAFSDYNS